MVGITPEIERAIADYICKLNEQIRVERVLLFGSRARGEALHESDIDLAIISPDFRDMPWIKRLEFLSILWNYGLPAECFGYTPEEFARRKDELGFVGEIHRWGKTVYQAD